MTADRPLSSVPPGIHRHPDDDLRFKLARVVLDKGIIGIPVLGAAAIFGKEAGVYVWCVVAGAALVAGVIAGGKKEIFAFSRVVGEVAGFAGTLWGTEQALAHFAGMRPDQGWILGGVGYFVARTIGFCIESEMKRSAREKAERAAQRKNTGIAYQLHDAMQRASAGFDGVRTARDYLLDGEQVYGSHYAKNFEGAEKPQAQLPPVSEQPSKLEV
jgi:uncharacterized membrane protein